MESKNEGERVSPPLLSATRQPRRMNARCAICSRPFIAPRALPEALGIVTALECDACSGDPAAVKRWIAARVAYVAQHAPVTIDRCTTCHEPTHASESNDLGECATCADAAGRPHVSEAA